MIYSEGQRGEDVEEIWVYPAAAVPAQTDGPCALFVTPVLGRRSG